MTPEEKFNSEVWWVLQKIKEAYLKTPSLESLSAGDKVRIFPKPSATIKASEIIEIEKLQRDGYTIIREPYGTEFKTGSIIGANQPSEDDQKRIVYILQGKGALKILDENSNDWEGTRFVLQIIQPEFDGIYKKYESIISDTEEQKKRDKILQGLANKNQLISQNNAWQEYERKQKERHEEDERSFQRRMDEERKDRESGELVRIQRMAASGKPPLIYTIEKIIEKCLINQNADKIQIDFYSLGFEDSLTEVCNAHRFFNQLKENGCFEDVERSANTWFVVTHPNIEKLKIYKAILEKELITDQKETSFFQDKNLLKSIHLVTTSLEPASVIFLVLDGRFEMPIRCAVKNDKGEAAYIKKLYDIAYIVDVPGKKVSYEKNLADSINNGLFRKRQVSKYMRTNNLKKPTLVQKSGDKTLVLKNEIPVKTALVKNIPVQHQSLYIDKTK